MRLPRKPVPPNTVTVRPFVTTMTQIRQLCRSVSLLAGEEPIRAIEQSFAMMKSFTGSVAVGRPPLLLILCWCARKHGRHTFRIDVEGQEYQRLVAWVSPLVHEGIRFIDQGTRSPCFCFAVDRVGPGARDDEVQSRARPMVWRVGRHPRRKYD